MTELLVAFATLTVLEIVLGVDNVIFISILSSKLPHDQQPRARRMGLLAAMLMRILLLLSIAWIIRLTAPFFTVLGRGISGRDLILIGGGLFLLAKATIEIHDRLEGEEGHRSARVRPSFAAVIIQIMPLLTWLTNAIRSNCSRTPATTKVITTTRSCHKNRTPKMTQSLTRRVAEHYPVTRTQYLCHRHQSFSALQAAAMVRLISSG